MIKLPVKNSRDTYTVNPTKLIALGLNYRAHIAESVSVKVKGFTYEVPTEPLLFPKTPNVLIGPDQAIVIPKFLKEYGFKALRTDYEAELALIIKDRCKDVPVDEAMDHIFGYTCMNDISQRNIQNGDRTGWYRGKSLDTFGPIGPQVVLTQDLPDPQDLDICCRLNGTTVQEGNIRQMIFKIPEILSFVSKNFTLMPGDIILTGTPAGVGPLSHGDTVEVEIEHIGVLKNTVIDETI
ncbi:MAG: fumarylacetoacetate hydrolase family protein [Desulfosarcina sp.]|nr:fumarylacetoacetate hydrolase family protein [Desulfosarcina sp.]MBC2744486.1 fumarylacetoacetate hydrolase family protein [Desulfosarcina sp.]MBC2767394.1 fumarylacetoacetate hydrolase family protein [Desulfosarcina sp.]